MISRPATAALCLLLLGTLTTGCGPGQPQAPLATVPPTAPITMDRPTLDRDARELAAARAKTPRRVVEGPDFWFVAPSGFRPLPKDNPAGKPMAAFWTRGEGASADGIWVWEGSAGGAFAKRGRTFERAVIKTLAAEVRQVDVVRPAAALDGRKVVHLQGVSKLGPATIDLISAQTSDGLCTLRIQLSGHHPEAERTAIVRQVMKTWHWDIP